MTIDPKLITTIKGGKLAVIPTDTLYGIVASAQNPKAVKRLINIRRESNDKPFIVLISSIDELADFGVNIDKFRSKMDRFWPGPVSLILPIKPGLDYLDLGRGNLAFRLPKDDRILEILSKTGPIVAPSANLPGRKPAKTIQEAINYFGDQVDYYLDAGTVSSEPSRLISLLDDKEVVVR